MYSLPYYALFPGLGVGRVCAVCCLCVIRALASVGVCGWGQGIATPHTAVLSPRSPLSILSAELLLLALNVSFWGRGREFSQIPTVQPSARHVSFKTRPSLCLLRRGGREPVGPPLAGDRSVGGRRRAWGGRGPPLLLRTLRPPPQSGAPGKVSASARDSPWPLPSPRAPEPRPPRRLLSRDPVPLTLSSTEAQGQGRRRARGRLGRIASSRCEVTSAPGILESPRLPRASGPRGLPLIGAAGGDPVPGGFRREPGVSWASYPAAAEPRVGEPGLCVCLRPSIRAQPWGIWGRLPRVSPEPELWQNRRWELLLPLAFLFKNKQNKKTFKPVWGEIGCPTD